MSLRFIIKGGRALAGEIRIQGSKNTALPAIAACLLTEARCFLENVPAISDVDAMAAMAERLGAAVEWDREKNRLIIEARNLSGNAPDADLSRKLRGSVLFAGALLGRMRGAKLSYPGGDLIGTRSLGVHSRAFEDLGATVHENAMVDIDGKNLHGGEIFLEEPSVTATENVILASVLAPGRTVIHLPAFEPHVQELVQMLLRMGANIKWRDLFVLEIEGVGKLRGVSYRLNADEIEVSSFSALAAATRSSIALSGIEQKYLDAIFLQLKKMGVRFEITSDGTRLEIAKPASAYSGFRIQSGLYPKLGSDHVPPFAVLATQAEGESLIHDWMYENRLRYIAELKKMGAVCEILDPHRARISGPTKLIGCETVSSDIRSGMTLIVAALVAEGETVISGVEHLDRGYENIDERLRGLGADIKRV